MFRIFNPDAAPVRPVALKHAAGSEIQPGPGAHRSSAPVRTPVAPVISQAVDQRILDLSAQVAAGDVRLMVPESSAASYAALPLRSWYFCDSFGPAAQRARDVAAKRTKPATAEKDLSALQVWEKYTRPAEWEGHWPGISIGSITAQYLQQFVKSALAGGLSAGYLGGLINHLSWILSIAKERGVLLAVPRKPPVTQLAASLSIDNDDLTVIYELSGEILVCLGAICSHLAGQPELRQAFVLACSCGLRPRDLFSLRWNHFAAVSGQPSLRITPEKTKRHGKTIRIPIAQSIWEGLSAYREATAAADDALLFPGLVSADAVDPEKSRSARRRNSAIMKAAEAAGFIFPDRRRKPWQIARATANERLERHRPGVGEFVLGHMSGSINARHYRQRWSEICAAVNSLPQPPEFLEKRSDST